MWKDIMSLLALSLSVLLLSSVASVRGGSSSNNNFVTVRATCGADGGIDVTLATSEPFEGLVYARSNPSTCRY